MWPVENKLKLISYRSPKKHDIMSIIRFIFSSPEQDNSKSLIGTLQYRQFEVIGGYYFVWNKFKKVEIDRIKTLIGEENQDKEFQSLYAATKPTILFVRSKQTGTDMFVDNSYNENKDMLSNWHSIQNLEPLPKKNVFEFVQNLERCEINTHIFLLVLHDFRKQNELLLKSRTRDNPGKIVRYGYIKGLADIISNPIQVPFAPQEKCYAQTVWLNNEKIRNPGYLLNKKLPHVIAWFDVSFDSETVRYYFDSASAQLDITKAKPFIISSNIDEFSYFSMESVHIFDLRETMNKIYYMIHIMKEKLSAETSQKIKQALIEMVEIIDRTYQTRLKTYFDVPLFSTI